METQKLFNLLVVGGALLGNYVTAAAPQSSVALEEPGQTEELQPLLCNQPNACVVNSCTGKSEPKAGFECCWGTHCEQSQE